MNFPRHEFTKEVEPDLLNFLRVATKQKQCNKSCDLERYKVWSQLLPPDPNLIQKVEENEKSSENLTVDAASENADISQVETIIDDEEVEPPNEAEIDDPAAENGINASDNDLVCGIKEDLKTNQCLTDKILQRIVKYGPSDLEELFKLLDSSLTSEEVFHLGKSLENSVPTNVITGFCNNLLIPRIKKEYRDKLFELLDQFSMKFGAPLTDEMTLLLPTLQPQEYVVILNYLKKLNSNFQTALLRSFIFTIETLDKNHFEIIDSLLNAEVDHVVLNKLVELMSNVAEQHSRDRNFGRLLMHIIEALGPHVALLEQPLKHIIARHKSVWKSKLDKTFSSCYEDSQLFSQSFRD